MRVRLSGVRTSNSATTVPTRSHSSKLRNTFAPAATTASVRLMEDTETIGTHVFSNTSYHCRGVCSNRAVNHDGIVLLGSG